MNEIVLVVLAAVALVLLLLGRAVDGIRKRIRVLGRIEAKLDHLMKHANIEFEPYRGLAPEVIDALQRGQKIEAIKSYRAATGLGLKEAKEAIEDIQRRAGV
jgi:ribosomal protein L7/L12